MRGKRHPEGHYMNRGIAIGLPIGILLGLLLFGVLGENIALGLALGPAFGMGIGVAIGAYLERKHGEKLRPLTENEKMLRKFGVFAGSAVLGIVVLLLLVALFYR